MVEKIIKLIFFGDISGKIARQAVAKIIPSWQKKYQPDVWLANVENLAHGKGITKKTLEEMSELGINIMTSGNHVWKKEDANFLATLPQFNLITPDNDPRTPFGQGYKLITLGEYKILAINLLAQAGMTLNPDLDVPENQATSPFEAVDKILKLPEAVEANAIIVDFHGELTSETRALGWHLDGRVSAVLGTHTHVPTADAQIMPNGTGYITDIGMVGAYETVLGIKKDIILKRFLEQAKFTFETPDQGLVEIGAVYLEIDPITKKTIKIKHLRKMVEIN